MVVYDAFQCVTIVDQYIIGSHHNMTTVAQVYHSVSAEQSSVFKLLSNVKGKGTTNVVQGVYTIFFVDDKLVTQLQGSQDMPLGACQRCLC